MFGNSKRFYSSYVNVANEKLTTNWSMILFILGPGHPSMIAVYSILPVVSILIIVSFVGVRAHRRNKLRSIDRKRGTGMPQTQLNTLYGKVYYTSNSRFVAT